jgi:hypothetical protein
MTLACRFGTHSACSVCGREESSKRDESLTIKSHWMPRPIPFPVSCERSREHPK